MSMRTPPHPPLENHSDTSGYQRYISHNAEDEGVRSSMRRRGTIQQAHKNGTVAALRANRGSHAANRSIFRFSVEERSPLTPVKPVNNSINTTPLLGKQKASGGVLQYTPEGFFDGDVTTTPVRIGVESSSVRSWGSSRKSARKKKVRCSHDKDMNFPNTHTTSVTSLTHILAEYVRVGKCGRAGQRD